MDDAICKAEEQVEKFTEVAKETKVLLCNLKKNDYFLSLVPLLLDCTFLEEYLKICVCRLVRLFSTNQS